MELLLNFEPALELAAAERRAAERLAAAEREDAQRRADVAAGTRQPPARGERPYLKAAAGRASVHQASAELLASRVTETISLFERLKRLHAEFDRFDAEVADVLELRFWHLWMSLPEAARVGFLGFYPNGQHKDYGNPSFERNRSWWQRAARQFQTGAAPWPAELAALSEQVIATAHRYAELFDQDRAAEAALVTAWKELVTLGRTCRKDRRSTRSYLRDDFDGQTRWVDALVEPPSDQPTRSTRSSTPVS